MLTLLGEAVGEFPDVETALTDPDGLLALGGDLSVARLRHAYRNGIFPWFSVGDPIMWWSPAERCVLYPNHYQPSRSLRKLARKHPFTLTIDQAFKDVITACAESTPERPDTWITQEMLDAYCALHQQGDAHSIEVWQGDALVGGLYGIQVNGVFCGESMFSRVSNASKVAFLYLIEQATQVGIQLIDCQLENPHLTRLGATLISRAQFIAQLTQWRETNTLPLGSNHTDEC